MVTPERLKQLPGKPGVYMFKDASGDVLYVGKAASLKNRVRSYFNAGNTRLLTSMMTSKADDVEWITTDTEIEALLLESNLIKQYRPRFNIRLRDDKQFPYLCVTVQEPFPRIFRVRRTRKDGARYFGPYANSGSLNQTLSMLRKLFPYRSCDIAIPDEAQHPGPVLDRPCLEYYIKRCGAPCVRFVSRSEYRETIDQVLLFLEGKHEQVLSILRNRMREYADSLNFEGAAYVRDQILAVERSVERQKIMSVSGREYDVIGVAADGRDASAQVFQIRSGRIVDRQHFMLDNPSEGGDEEILSAFLRQFYERAAHVPRGILLPGDLADRILFEEWLGGLRGGPVELSIPRRGEKKKLVDMVAANARDVLEQTKQRWLSDREKTSIALAELEAGLGLREAPARIECFDISTIQGASTVAAMVVFEEGRSKNSEYRRFRIRTPENLGRAGVASPDDFSAMREVIKRRFWRSRNPDAGLFQPGIPEPAKTTEVSNGSGTRREQDAGRVEPGSSGPCPGNPEAMPLTTEYSVQSEAELEKAASWRQLPDLVVIDGGKGQLAAALEALEELGIHGQQVVGLAKRQEEVFLPGRSASVLLPRDSEGLYLLQRIRDEAHRFAVTYHRQVRSKRAQVSILDGFRGIGPVKRRALIKAFGSLKGVREASIEEIAAVPGMNPTMAASLKHYLAE